MLARFRLIIRLRHLIWSQPSATGVRGLAGLRHMPGLADGGVAPAVTECALEGEEGAGPCA